MKKCLLLFYLAKTNTVKELLKLEIVNIKIEALLSQSQKSAPDNFLVLILCLQY